MRSVFWKGQASRRAPASPRWPPALLPALPRGQVQLSDCQWTALGRGARKAVRVVRGWLVATQLTRGPRSPPRLSAAAPRPPFRAATGDAVN
jgi:hypothetical protein